LTTLSLKPLKNKLKYLILISVLVFGGCGEKEEKIDSRLFGNWSTTCSIYPAITNINQEEIYSFHGYIFRKDNTFSRSGGLFTNSQCDDHYDPLAKGILAEDFEGNFVINQVSKDPNAKSESGTFTLYYDSGRVVTLEYVISGTRLIERFIRSNDEHSNPSSQWNLLELSNISH